MTGSPAPHETEPPAIVASGSAGQRTGLNGSVPGHQPQAGDAGVLLGVGQLVGEVADAVRQPAAGPGRAWRGCRARRRRRRGRRCRSLPGTPGVTV